MALTKLQFKPGIVKETTNYAQSGGWFDADKVRFRQGCPEKIGGWQSISATPFKGTCRYLHQWSGLETGDRYIALGTSSHLYVFWSGNYYDITPVRITINLGTDPFTTVHVGTTDMYVAIPNHGASVGDYVHFHGATTGVDTDGSGNPVYTADNLNQEFEVTAVIDDNTIMIHLLTEVIDPVTLEATGVTLNAGVSGGGPNITATFSIPSGLDDAVVGAGWGIPPWNGGPPMTATSPGAVGWGMPFNLTTLHPDSTVNQIRLWDIDNFGEDLVANVRNGPIYYWHEEAGFDQHAVNLNETITVNNVTFTPSDVPTIAVQVIVSPNDRHLIAMGCNDVGQILQDPLLVRWSNAEDAYMWTPLRTNDAGGQRLSAGSYIVCGMRTRQEILIWTDLGMWSMRYIGSPYIFGFDSIAEGLSILGPNSCINTGNYVLWMDRGIFYAYTGQIQELPCAVKDYVFDDLNYLQAYKIYAGHNHAFSEVIWFYPSAASVENDRYVIYNYTDQIWSHGTIQRTAWLNMGRDSYPIATDRENSLLYYHEMGDDADGAPLPSYIDSADIDADGGDHYLYLSRFIPDVFFRGSGDKCSQSVGVTIFTRRTPHEPRIPAARFMVQPYLDQERKNAEKYIRLRDRQISFRFESSALGVGWRLGTVRADMQPDGRR